MLRPYAGSFWAHNGAQCADAPPGGLCPPRSQPAPLLLEGPQTGLCESGRLHRRARCDANTHPLFRPGHLPLTSPPHTALFCAPNLPHHPKGRRRKKTVFLTVWLKLDELNATTSFTIPPTAKGNTGFLIFLIIIMDNITNYTIRPQNIVKLQKKKHPS